MPRLLLVPMDDSEPARAALEHALSVFPNDELRVVHVVDDLEAAYGGRPPVATGGEDGEDDPEFFADVRAIAGDHDRDEDVEATVIEGTSAERILEYADEVEADQIVMGSEGRSGVSRMLLGSVAETVTRQSSIPVTIVP